MGGGCGGSGAAKWVRVGILVSGAGVVGWMEAW